MMFFTEVEQQQQQQPSFIWKYKCCTVARATFSRKNNTRGVIIPNFKLYYRAIETKPVRYWCEKRHPWNRGPRNKPNR